MNILMLGDVVGSAGCAAIRQKLPALKKYYQADAVIINGENSADGNGITPASAKSLFDSGADVITGGNHSFRRREIYEEYERNPFLLRPCNVPAGAPGTGYAVIDRGAWRMAVISLLGTASIFPAPDCPFTAADRWVARAEQDGCGLILIDFHAESTAEKKAMGFYLDGRVTALIGTHTHIPTADCQLLPGGTAYRTDTGMCGPYLSVLGVKPELSIAFLKQKLPVRFANAETPPVLQGCLIDADTKSGRAQSIEPVEVFLPQS